MAVGRMLLQSSGRLMNRRLLLSPPPHHRPINSRRSLVVTGRTLAAAAVSSSSELPYHLVVGLPALSPTMESGSLAEWYVAEGDGFGAGDALCKIETDKAAIDFEAQDDGYVAKILVEPGHGNDLPVGTPIMVTVEEEGDVPAFKDFAAPAAAEAAPAQAPEPAAAAPEPAVEAARRAAPAAAAPPPSPPPPPPAPVAVGGAVPEVVVAGAFSTAAWGLSAVGSSPLARTLAASQKKYLDLYGTTGQRPIL